MKLPILFVPHPASSCQIVNPKPFLSRAKPPKLMHGAPTCECHSRPSNISARLHCRQSGRHHGTVHLKLTSAKSQLRGKLSEIAYVPLLACADVQLTLHYTVVQCHNIKKKKPLGCDCINIILNINDQQNSQDSFSCSQVTLTLRSSVSPVLTKARKSDNAWRQCPAFSQAVTAELRVAKVLLLGHLHPSGRRMNHLDWKERKINR